MAAQPNTKERETLDYQYGRLKRFADAASAVATFLRSASIELVANNALLLLGGWGMGKTHALCDLTETRMRLHLPTLFFLGQRIPVGSNPLDGLCQATGLAATRRELLRELERIGRHRRTRALLIIDAVNEGDRIRWKQNITAIVREVSQFRHVGLILSCRQPFDQQILSKRATKKFVVVYHQGFSEIEFDAQLSFFQHYNIPSPQVPLITPEYSRPLFLQLLCQAIANLSTAGKHRQLRSFASGQKGMTYLLEYFCKKIGAPIEADFRLQGGKCWQVLKGQPISHCGATFGVASRMATELRDYLTWDECLHEVVAFVNGPRRRQTARRLVRRMITDGILAEDLRWENNRYLEVVRFPYQRFGDHIIARSLLRHLTTASPTTIRRSFYGNQPLGRIFELSPDRRSFQRPGFASAIMLEFPERVVGHVPPDEIGLIFYLPRVRRLVAPCKDAFLEGLPWRNAAHFSRVTYGLITSFLERYGGETRNETFEVLVGLATRPGHPCSAERLWRWLAALPMNKRDLWWSEFLRHAEDTSVVLKLLEWAERNAGRSLRSDVVVPAIKLISMMLTSVHRPFRDRATRAAMLLGLDHPRALFEHALTSLAFTDPYVPERMLAASYGVAMSLWSAPEGAAMRSALAPFAQNLVTQMFVPGAPAATRHVLLRDYALGTIELARRIDERTIPRRRRCFLRRPFAHLPALMPAARVLTRRRKAEVEPALHMDFDNYTLGHLVHGRQNYDFRNREYQRVRDQLLRRMYRLGYSSSRFKVIDDLIGRFNWDRGNRPDKTDRYGKKYSWIAYFELCGLREDTGKLGDRDRRFERTSSCDIDPSFPLPPAEWSPTLPDVFRRSPRQDVDWLRHGPVPRYDHVLTRTSINRIRGPWVLLNGFIEQQASNDPRVVFTFLRGLFVTERRADRLSRTLSRTAYPGNDAIPRPYEDNYTFAGEIPWSLTFGGGLRSASGRPIRNVQSAFERWRQNRRALDIPVEVPVH